MQKTNQKKKSIKLNCMYILGVSRTFVVSPFFVIFYLCHLFKWCIVMLFLDFAFEPELPARFSANSLSAFRLRAKLSSLLILDNFLFLLLCAKH